MRLSAKWVVLLVAVAGCHSAKVNGNGGACQTSADCDALLICYRNQCLTPRQISSTKPTATPTPSPTPTPSITPSLTPSPSPTPSPRAVFDTIAAQPTLTSLAKALKFAQLDTALNASASLTVFAPTDTAIAQFKTATGLDLTTGTTPTQWLTLLQYHVTADPNFAPAQGNAYASLFAAATSPLKITGTDLNGFVVNQLTQALTVNRLTATNGAVYLVDSVIVPPNTLATLSATQIVASYPILSTLSSALGIGTFDAGRGLVTVAATLDAKAATATAVTLLAPVNSAFKNLPVDYLTALTTRADKASELGSLLAYHVLTSANDSSALLAKATTIQGQGTDNALITLGGGKIRFALSPVATGALTLNQTTQLVARDLVVKNAIIHLIDSVLVPAAADDSIDFPGTIVDFCTAYPAVFSNLLASVSNNGLATAVTPAEANPITLFAPNNVAFKGAVVALEANKLKLQTHVATLAVSAAMLKADATATNGLGNPAPVLLPTAAGANLTPVFTDPATLINASSPFGLSVQNVSATTGGPANLLRADIKVKCNSSSPTNACLVHIIDAVLQNP